MFKISKIINTITNWCLNKKKIKIGELHNLLSPSACEIYSDHDDNLKFVQQTIPLNILVETPTGYSEILHTHKTVPYVVWEISTKNKRLLCADEHILMDEFDNELFVKDINIGTKIKTDDGIESITSVKNLDFSDSMFDLELSDGRNVYYTNGILSHNSSTSAAYILWFTLFNFDKTVLITSYKGDLAKEIIDRIQFAYEYTPFFLKCGIPEGGWNKHSMAFDNKSRIISTTTSETSGRGLSISLLFCDELAHVKPHVQKEFWTSIAPTLATGGSCIIASTPNGDTELFSKLWRGAQVNLTVEGSDVQFNPIHVKWDDVPGRDEEFKKKEIANSSLQEWLQEYECVHGTTLITIRDKTTHEITEITIEELYNLL